MCNYKIGTLSYGDDISRYKSFIIVGANETKEKDSRRISEGECIFIPFVEGEFSGYSNTSHATYAKKVLPNFKFGEKEGKDIKTFSYIRELAKRGCIVVEEQTELPKGINVWRMTDDEIKIAASEANRIMAIYMPYIEQITKSQESTLLKLKQLLKEGGYIVDIYLAMEDKYFRKPGAMPEIIDTFVNDMKEKRKIKLERQHPSDLKIILGDTTVEFINNDEQTIKIQQGSNLGFSFSQHVLPDRTLFTATIGDDIDNTTFSIGSIKRTIEYGTMENDNDNIQIISDSISVTNNGIPTESLKYDEEEGVYVNTSTSERINGRTIIERLTDLNTFFRSKKLPITFGKLFAEIEDMEQNGVETIREGSNVGKFLLGCSNLLRKANEMYSEKPHLFEQRPDRIH